MPRKLKFILPGKKSLEASITKVNREKIYGSVEIKAYDEDGNECELLSLAGDGKTIFGRGSVANVVVDPEGNVVDKSKLTAVTIDGDPVEPHKSSFTDDIVVKEKATVEEFLSHIVKSVYELNIEDPEEEKTLVKLLKDGSIFRFDFSYRDGIVKDVAFLISNADNVPFMILANPANINFVSFKDASALDADAVEADEEDLLDFDVL